MEISASPVLKVILDFLKSDKRILVLEGGSRSTKTYSIIQALNLLAIDPSYYYKEITEKLKITACRAYSAWLAPTILVDFYDILSSQFGDFYDPRHERKNPPTYDANASFFRFVGLDEKKKVHGMKSDILWINEAMEAPKDSVRQLMMRTTGKIIFDYNPSATEHWIFETIVPREDCVFHHSTYKDNPFLEKEIIREIEVFEPTEENIAQGTADEVMWKIYGLGERAAHEGLIYKDWKIVDYYPPEDLRSKEWYWIDFGFTNDPTAIGRSCMSQGEIYHDELVYERKLTNIINPNKPEQLSIELRLKENNVSKRDYIWADAAEPKSIQDLCNCGFNVTAAPKGKDSIVHGIDNMKRFKHNVTKRSMNIIKEKNNYKWRETKEGEKENVPVDAFNHAMDGARYGVTGTYPHLGKQRKALYTTANHIKPSTTMTVADKIKYYNARRSRSGGSFD